MATNDTDKIGILVVDDEPDIRGLLGEFLTQRGYRVTLGKNGREAIDCVQGDPRIAVVLLDVSMPGMGGLDALAGIMKVDPHPSVIMMTAISDRDVARNALRIGAIDYILKPFEFAAIEAGIAGCLNRSGNQTQPWWNRLTQH